ncbi:hypothetical protein MD484_g4834, partial [Candolleomyces efflorescens]
MSLCSSILSLLSTNSAPGPLEAAPLRAEVERLTNKISSLRAELQEYEGLLRKHQTALSIIRRVPLDVLATIFSFVLPDCSTRQDWQVAKNLSLVCKDWHYVGHHFHRPSSTLHLMESKVDYDLVMAWSRRVGGVAGGRTLTVESVNGSRNCSVCPRHPEDDDEVKDARCAFATPALLRLMLEGPILEHLRFTYVEIRCYQHLLDLIASSGASSNARTWNNVKRFTLHIHEVWTPPSAILAADVPPGITSFDFKPPRLTFAVNCPPLLIPLTAFERLTSFSFSWHWVEYSGEALVTVLAHCANLETLTLDFQDQESWLYPDHSEVVKLPKLWKLKITQPNDDSIKLLNLLDTPALTHFEIDLGFCSVNTDVVKSFLSQSSAISQGVGHAGLSFPWASLNFAEFLQRVPYFTHLRVHSYFEGTNLFPCLSRARDTLSRLKVLEISDFPIEMSMIQSLASYIILRQNDRAQNALTTVSVKFQSTLRLLGCVNSSKKAIELLESAGTSLAVEFPELFQEGVGLGQSHG